MGSFAYWPRPGDAYADADQRFEMLRGLFQDRLRHDRVELRRLDSALTGGSGDSAGLFEEIQRVAHRIAGAAALFEEREVCAAAGSLEKAARLAYHKRAANDDERVWQAVQVLMVVLPA
jgi:HPt (histidine-containing phosphotransfer) domain-containing protein